MSSDHTATDVDTGPPAGHTTGYDRRPLAAGELPLAHLPADVEAHLAAVEQRLADHLGEALGVPVEAGASRPSLPLADAGQCSPAGCAGPCEPAAGAHTAPARGEPLFTMAEALQEIAEKTCAAEGHDLDVISTDVISERTPRPIAIMCRRPCQFRGYRVVPIGEPDVAELLTAALLDLWADLGAAYDRSPAAPRESSIECRGLITRIVDISRTLGTVPAEVVPPELVVAGLYVEVHRLAGHVATVAPCTLDTARAAVAERDAARGEARSTDWPLPAAPCERWSLAQTHDAHGWHARVDGPRYCPGLPPAAREVEAAD